MQPSEKKYNRVVIKIGSSLFYDGRELNPLALSEITSNISSLIISEKKEIVIVSSGAIALGMHELKIKDRPKELPFLQAAAAIGQNILMDNYSAWFKKHKITCGQVLLTREDFHERLRYLNAKNTLLKLLDLGVVTVINENDTVSTEEIKFGDNDRLSALVAGLINADLLIILSDVDGLLDRDRKLIPVVEEITPQIKSLACPTNKKTCVGGMITKLEAAKIACDSGILCIIANGRRKNAIIDAVRDPGSVGTLFLPKETLAERKRWIAFGSKAKGRIIVDEGAKGALLKKKSLLAVGVSEVEGDFSCGDIVSIRDKDNNEFARGRVALGSIELAEVKGTRIEKEVIHCDNIVIL